MLSTLSKTSNKKYLKKLMHKESPQFLSSISSPFAIFYLIELSRLNMLSWTSKNIMLMVLTNSYRGNIDKEDRVLKERVSFREISKFVIEICGK
jgi:hypothetical protein